MKIIYKIFAISLLITSFISCEQDDLTPDFSVTTTVDADNPNKITFSITGDAETFVIYTGDDGHDYDSSHLLLTDGKDVDLEERVLTQDGYDLIEPLLTARIESYNNSIDRVLPEVDVDYVLNGVKDNIDKEYTNSLNAKYEIAILMGDMMPDVSAFLDDIVTYFDDNSTLLAPVGGFSLGAVIHRYDKEYTYTYSEAGTYKAVVIATNLSTKNYSGSGYQDNATASASEYSYYREIKEVGVTIP